MLIKTTSVTVISFKPRLLLFSAQPKAKTYKDYKRGMIITNARIRARYAAPSQARVPALYLDEERRVSL